MNLPKLSFRNALPLIALHTLIIFQLAAQELEIIPVPLNFKDAPAAIGAMTQDNQGNIWMIDLNRGLFKYDGVNLSRYRNKANDPNSLSSDRLECITTSEDGMIWIGTFLNGLVRFDPI